MADPLAGVDLGAPDPTKKKPAAAPATDASGPLSGIDLSAPSPSAATKPATYDDTSLSGLAGDTAYRAANTGTLGALDYGLAGLHAIERGTGYDPNATDLTTIQRQGDEWGSNHPYLALGADLAGYGVGMGKLGLGARLAEGLGGRLAARIAGGAAENIGTGLVADELHSQGQASTGDLLKSALISGTIGGVTGGLPGSRGAMADAVSPKATLDAAKQAAFKPLENTHYDASGVANDFDAVTSNLAAKQSSGIGDTLDNQIDKISQSIAAKQKAGQSVTADDLTNFQIQLNAAGRGDTDARIAKQYGDALDNTMATTRPLFSPLSGPAAISAQSDAARAAALKSNVNSDIEGWMDSAKTDLAGTKKDITQSVKDKPNFYPTVGDNLLAASKPPGFGSKLAEGVAKDVAGTVAGGVIEGTFGSRDPWAIGAGSLAGLAATHGAGSVASQMRTNALVRKLAAAREANATGQTIDPSKFRKGFGPMSVNVYGYTPQGFVPGIGASGRFVPNRPDQQQ